MKKKTPAWTIVLEDNGACESAVRFARKHSTFLKALRALKGHSQEGAWLSWLGWKFGRITTTPRQEHALVCYNARGNSNYFGCAYEDEAADLLIIRDKLIKRLRIVAKRLAPTFKAHTR